MTPEECAAIEEALRAWDELNSSLVTKADRLRLDRIGAVLRGMDRPKDKALATERMLRDGFDAVRAVLKEIQWQPRYRTPGYDNDTCPICNGVDAAFIGGEGHAPDCRLAKCLEGT